MATFRVQVAGTSQYVTFEHPGETVVEVWYDVHSKGYLRAVSVSGEGARKVFMPWQQVGTISLVPPERPSIAMAG